jgi:methyl-accepting chemotaxis protein
VNYLGFRRTLLLSISVLIAVCLLTSNIYSYSQLRDKTISTVNEQSIRAVNVEADTIEKWFARNLRVIDALVEHQSQGIADDKYVSTANYAKAISDLDSVIFAFDDGRAYSTISGDGWVNGQVIIDQYDARKRSWYQLGQQNRQLQITDVFTSASTGKSLVAMVKGLSGGVLFGSIGLDILEERVKAMDFPGAVTVIFDHEGKTLASNSPQLKTGAFISSVGLQKLQQAIVEGQSKIDYQFNGADKVAFAHSIELLNGKQWYLFTGIDKSIAYAAAAQALKNQLGASLMMLVLSLGGFVLLLKVIYAPMLRLKQMILQLGSGTGDLTLRLPVDSHDDLGQMSKGINDFVANLQSMMCQVSDATQHIAGGIGHLQRLTDENHRTIFAHKGETDQVVTALDEMSATSSDVASNTAEAAEFTQKTNRQAAQSKTVVGTATSTVSQLLTEVENTSSRIGEINDEITNISSVLTIIGDIADQTNLLALNAAIEAARAGEQGRGFAVVADEVRALAARTQTSTAEIATTLEKLRLGAKHAISAMAQTKQSGQETAMATELVANDLDTINSSVEQINNLNTQIATAAEEQSAVADEITKTMATIREMVDNLSASSTATQSEATQLSVANQQLTAIVSQFKLR